MAFQDQEPKGVAMTGIRGMGFLGGYAPLLRVVRGEEGIPCYGRIHFGEIQSVGSGERLSIKAGTSGNKYLR